MKKTSKIFFILLFFVLLSEHVHATLSDSLNIKSNKISIDFSGGTNYRTSTYIKQYDYFGDAITLPDSLKNAVGKEFELNIKIPIFKKRLFVNIGVGYTERNVDLFIEEAYYIRYEPYVKSHFFKNDYVSLIAGLGYKFVDSKHFLFDATIGVMPAYLVFQKMQTNYYNNYYPTSISTSFHRYEEAFPVKRILAPMYLRANSYYKFTQHFAMGIGLGIFYDVIKPFPNNVLKNKINYSSNLIVRYTF